MTVVQESSRMLERADKWFRLIDTDEYHPDPQHVNTQVPSADGKNRSEFGLLLSRAMTNYQTISDLCHDFEQRAKEGRLSGNRAYLMGAGIPYDMIKELDNIALQDKFEHADSAMVEGIRNKRRLVARDFLYYVDYGIVNRILVVGEALRRKLGESEQEKKDIIEERDKLGQQLEQVSTELISVKALYEECQKSRALGPATGI